jgi:hypothetical protein
VSVRFEVDISGPHGAGTELDRLRDGPGPATLARFEMALLTAYVTSETRVHVITGHLKASGHPSSHYDGDQWHGEVDFARYPGVFELARGNAPTANHPEGGHYFFDPGGPEFLREVRQAMYDYVTHDMGGSAPVGDLGPYSGGHA